MSFAQSRVYNGLSAVVDRLFPKALVYDHEGYTKVVRRKPFINPYDFSGFEHERTILRKLEDVKGVPKFFTGGESRYGYQHPVGKPLVEAKLPSTYFKDLWGIVTAMHGLYVAGLDYSPNSVLMDADGNPVVTKLSGAIVYENGELPTYPKMQPIFMEHLEGFVNRRVRPSVTLRQDLQLSNRIKTYLRRKIKEQKRRKFEEAKRLDKGFILSLEMMYNPRDLTQEEIDNLGHFLTVQRVFS